MKKNIILLFLLYANLYQANAQYLTSIAPDSATQNQTLTATITGFNTQFTGSTMGMNINNINFTGPSSINATSWNVVNDTLLTVDFTIPSNVPSGIYNVTVNSLINGNLYLYNSFTIGIPPRIVSVNPDTATQNQTLTATITGINTNFFGATMGNVNGVYFNSSTGPLTTNSYNVTNDTLMDVDITVPSNAADNFYSLTVSTYSSESYTLIKALRIGNPPYIKTVSPASTHQGDTLVASITGSNTLFYNATINGSINYMYYRNPFNNATIGISPFNVINDTLVHGNVTVSNASPPGWYDLYINTSSQGILEKDSALLILRQALVYGDVYYDMNGNGARDVGEYGIKGQRLRLLPDSAITFSNSTGGYFFTVSPGLYNVEYVPDTNWLLASSPPSYAVTVVYSDTGGNDFGIEPVNLNYGISVSVASARLRCNSNVYFWINYQNTGFVQGDGMVKYIYDPNLTFVQSNPAPDVISGDTLWWSYTNLLLSEQRIIQMTFSVPGSPGTLISNISAAAIYDSFGSIAATAYDTLNQTVACSFDPNDKMVSPEGVQSGHYTLSTDELKYTIRFQNTGNDTAFKVVVIDTIDSNLDISTLRVLGSSHTVVTTINKNTVEFVFKNIQLPDSAVNESDSHGFVEYAIKPKSNLPIPTIIYNTAYIFFDANTPITTNTAFNTMVGIEPVQEFPDDQVLIYPNPFTDRATVAFYNPNREPFLFEVYDVLGKKKFELPVQTDVIHFSKQDIGKGIFFFRLVNQKTGKAYKGNFVAD